jgi:MFS family permease
MGSGGYFSLQSSIVAQIVGSHRVNQAIGVIELASSIGFLAGPISGGALLDAFGGPSAGAEAYKPAMVSHTTLLRDMGLMSCAHAVLGWRYNFRLGHSRSVD